MTFARFRPIFCALLFLLTLAAYWNSFHAPLVFDDIHTIGTNYDIRELSNIAKVLSSESANRPFLFVTFALNFAAGGLDTFGYHLVNFILHLATSLLVFLTVADILKREGLDNPVYAGFAALIFALHPLNVDAVTYISSRSSLLATFFYLLAFRLAVVSNFKAGWRHGASLLVFLLALLTKEIAVTLPALLTIFVLQFEGVEKLRRAGWFLATYWIIIPLLFVYRSFAMDDTLALPDSSYHLTPGIYFYTQLVVVAFRYMPRFLFPFNLSIDATNDFRLSFIDWQVIAGGLVLLLLALFAVIYFRKEKILSFSILWFLTALSVTSSVIPILDAYAERRLYVALPALCMALSYLAFRLCKRMPTAVKPVAVAGMVMIVAFGVLTFERNRLFASPKLLWEDTMRKTVGKPRIYSGLALQYSKEGNYEKAVEILRKAVRLYPDDIRVRLGLTSNLLAQRKFREMAKALAPAKPVRKNDLSKYHGFMAILEAEKGDLDKSMRHFTEALKQNPENQFALSNMLTLFIRAGKKEKALEMVKSELKKNPYSALLHFQLGKLLLESDREAAIREIKKSLEIDSFYIPARRALEHLSKEPVR